jgi:hypothetical protein
MVPGQTWDTVTATLTGPQLTSPQSLAVSGPDGNGSVTVNVDTSALGVGTYTVRITGLLLTQAISFQVKAP